MKFRLQIAAPFLAVASAYYGWLIPALALLAVWVIITWEGVTVDEEYIYTEDDEAGE